MPPADASARSPLVGGLVLAAGVLAVGVAWFGRSCFGGHFVDDPTRMMDTYHVSTLLDVYARHLANAPLGGFPLWLPEFSAGMPALGSWIYGFLSPGILLWVVLPAETAWTWSALLHMAFGAAGMYAFVMARRGRAEAAVTAALVFAVSEYFVGRAVSGQLNLVWPVAWAPWIMWQIVRCVHGRPGAVGWLALTSGLGLLAGHVQVWFWLGPVLAAFGLREIHVSGRGWRALRPLALGALLGVGITMAQFLPTLELFGIAGRRANEAYLLEQWSTAPYVLASKIAPGMLGWSRAARWSGFAFENESVAAGGLGICLLFVLGLRGRAGWRWFWIAVAAAGVAISLGKHTAASDAVNQLPVLAWGRVPGRALVMPLLATSVLAGHAVADWLESGEEATQRLRRALALTGGLAVVALFVFVRWSAGRDWSAAVGGVVRSHADVWRETAGPALAASILGGALVTGALVLARRRPRAAWWLPAAALAAALLSSVPPAGSVPSDFYRVDWRARVADEAAAHRVLLTEQRQPYVEHKGLRSYRRFSHVDTKWYVAVERDVNPDLAAWLDVGTMLLTSDNRSAAPAELSADVRVQSPPHPPIGRARLFHAAVRGLDDEAALAVMRTHRRELILAAGPPGRVGVDAPSRGGRVERAARKVVRPGTIEYLVTASVPGWLFSSEKYYPGWEAEVDGERVEIERANVAFQAVAVPAGTSRVRFTYRSAPATRGAYLSVLALLVSMGLAVRPMWRRRKEAS